MVRRDADASQARRADQAAGALGAASARLQADVRGLVGVFSTSREIDQFDQYAAPAKDGESLVALAWAPRVTQAMRAAFEAANGFPIAELGDGGVPVPAGRRPEVFPVLYVAPGAANVGLVGIDVASQEGLADALERALASGEPEATRPLELPRGGRGIAVVAPAFRRGAATGTAAERATALTGYAVAWYDLDLLGAAAFASFKDVGIAVIDGGATVFGRGDATGGQLRDVEVAGRTWRVTINATVAQTQALLPWTVLGGGILVALLIAAMVEQNARRLAFAEGVVALRTVELRTALDRLHSANAELDAARAAAERASQVDAQTGAYNRVHTLELIGIELNRAQRGDTTPAVILLDVDDYRELGEMFGPEACDAVMVEIAKRLRRVLRSYDSLGRWGHRQFAILAPNVRTDEALYRVAEAVRTVVAAAPLVVGGNEIWPTVSVGAARAGEHFDPFRLVGEADAALADAHARGRDRTALGGAATGSESEAGEPDTVRIAQALALSASVREGMPEHHNRDIAELAADLASSLRLSEAMVERCRLAGWLHDVGKVGVPEEILSKPGALDDEEWVVMRTHAALGEAIVARILTLADAAPGVRHHHERWDGSGYPDALEGPAIPIEARIVAVADAYTAMMADPPFRRARGPRAALRELVDGSGSQFDPIVVDALRRVVEARANAA